MSVNKLRNLTFFYVLYRWQTFTFNVYRACVLHAEIRSSWWHARDKGR